MNQYDVSGLLQTYSQKCMLVKNSEKLKEIIKELKHELNSKEINKMKVD